MIKADMCKAEQVLGPYTTLLPKKLFNMNLKETEIGIMSFSSWLENIYSSFHHRNFFVVIPWVPLSITSYLQVSWNKAFENFNTL